VTGATTRDVPELLRAPHPDVRSTTVIGRYLGWLDEHRGLQFDDYDALHRWSVTDLEGFWSSIRDHF
jgi:acetoacetyl-CoA synthetase